jgi:hypothetical protein
VHRNPPGKVFSARVHRLTERARQVSPDAEGLIAVESLRWQPNPKAGDSCGKTGQDDRASRGKAVIAGTMLMPQSTILTSQDSPVGPSRSRLWRRRALIFGLTSASTAALLLCPCDCVGQSQYAIFLIAISVLMGGCAAVLFYRVMRRRSDITAFLKAVISIAIVIFAVYAEFAVAMEVIAWLALHGR